MSIVQIKTILLFLILISNKVNADELVFEEIKEKIPEEYCLKVLNMGKFIGYYDVPHSNPNKHSIEQRFIFNNELIIVKFRYRNKSEGFLQKRMKIYISCKRYRNIFKNKND